MTDGIDELPEPETEIEGPPIYVARKLADAKRLEEVFTSAAIDYVVEPNTYQGGLIFRTQRVGAFFYVSSETWDKAASVMQENGFRPLKP